MGANNDVDRKPSLFLSGSVSLFFLVILLYLGYKGFLGGNVAEIVVSVLFTQTSLSWLQFILAGLILLATALAVYTLISIALSLLSLMLGETWKSFKNINIEDEAFILEEMKVLFAKTDDKNKQAKIDSLKTIADLKLFLINRKIHQFVPEFYVLIGVIAIIFILYLILNI